MRLLALLALTSSCATLNTAGMSAPCRDLYNACLNSCPQAPAPAPGMLNDWHIDTAQCTDRCNAEAKRCDSPRAPAN